ncbi:MULTISPECIES: class D beta-lactamase [unclassified Leeuwenhoekiella]|uniref:class D beta-lactamase n=1 Tax=unclassified Leeuwenhoekiella TaxID=2615029 RepID=UPI000C607EFE|nr:MULTISPECIES: class D beta-lactamase [unclassified Leeuwenhoekiella]MAW94071.1 class D beta-lactamase [Leeuwenhoekiella sp.]MBA80890.1 class D beta-lactamase [Leeuwenhoekiella sp.]|tara:strand:- start:73586 stop:74428 length:843 start_codon:yes stop_codon:yes gene_type:complete
MKKNYFALILATFFSCTNHKEASDKKVDTPVVEREILTPEFQTILDSAGVEGSILIYDLKNDTYYSNDFQWATKGRLPASTFKITNSIIALETGVVENDSTLFKWNGEKRSLKVWEQDLILKDAFHFSCVPCYQEVARNIGAQRMSAYLDKLEYGAMDVDSTNIDMFWLEGGSKISQFQQIDFLKRFYKSQLPISERTEKIMKRMMILEENENYTLRGKTGWSIRNGNNNGWFVGYLENGSDTYFFATNINPNADFNMDLFPMIRKEVTLEALRNLNLMG